MSGTDGRVLGRALGIAASSSSDGGVGWAVHTGGGVVSRTLPIRRDAYAFVAVVFNQHERSAMLYVDGETITETNTDLPFDQAQLQIGGSGT